MDGQEVWLSSDLPVCERPQKDNVLDKTVAGNREDSLELDYEVEGKWQEWVLEAVPKEIFKQKNIVPGAECI